MKKIYLLAFSFITISTSIFSQNVNVSGALVGNGTYPDLGSAFTAINGGAQTAANILVDIVGNTTEPVSAVLNESVGPWATLTISPAGGASRTISGNIAGHMIDFNGADDITIDGLNSGGNFLFIDNSNGGSSTSTIRFVNDASNNTVIRTNINGSAGNTLGTGFGVIYFGTGTVSGNDNNSINNCNITGSSGGTPLNAIYSFGSSAAIDNSSNTISVNNISDYFSAGTASAGMNINSNNSGWTITNNALYQTATRTTTTAGITHNGIVITSGAGYTISNNVIGFANPAATGTTNMIGLSAGSLGGTFPSAFTAGGTAVNNRYTAINCAFTAGGAVSSIQNNTIGGIALYTSSGANTTFGVICGIAVTSGNANIGTVTGNTIGSSSGTSSIYAATTTAGGVISGIYVTSTNTVDVQNNIIGGINVSGTSNTTAAGFKGIEVAGAGTHTASNNIIGSSVANNIKTGYLLAGGNLSNVPTSFTSASGAATVQGIVSNNTGAATSVNLNNNIVRGIQIGGSATTFYGVRSQLPATTVNINNNQLGTSSVGLLTIMFANSGGILCTGNEGTGASTNATLNNNIFQGVTYMAEGSGSFRCISASGTMLSYVMNNNNFNNLTVNTSGSTQGFLIGATNNTPTVTISGNYVTTQFSNVSITGTANWIGIMCNSGTPATGSSTITNNNISNLTFRTTTSLGGGIYWLVGNVAGTTHNLNVSNNVLNNIVNVGTATTAATYALTVGFGNTNTIANNTVSNIYGKAQTIGLLTNSASLNAAGSFAVNNNVVHHIYSSTATSQAQGIQTAAGPTQNTFKNKVYEINCTGAGVVIGLTQSNATVGSISNIYNNTIGKLYAPSNNFFQGVRGISISGTIANTVNLYYNNLYLDGSNPTQSYCVYTGALIATTNFRNNVFVNNITATGGSTVPSMVLYRNGVSSLATYAATTNNNILYAGTPGTSNIIYADGAVNALTNIQQTLANYQAFVTPREVNSFTENTPFLSTSGSASSFLHVNPLVATAVESGAVDIPTYGDDYDAEIRQGYGGYPGTGTAPDVGADEIDVTIDRLAPDIDYTALTNTTCLTNRTFTATISDASNVNTTIGTRPRVYYRKTTNANALGATNDNTTNGWKWAEASNALSPFSFTIDYALVFGGVAAGDVIEYFVVAEDLSATVNVAINSGTFTTQPATVALPTGSFPINGFINSYSINTTIPASVTIGAAGTYTSLTGVNGLFADINNKGLSANTVANIIDLSVTETGHIALNQMAGDCALSNYSLTIKPNATGTTLTGAYPSNGLIRIKSSNVIIDGSFNGSTSRDLTITNTSVTTPSVVLFGSTATIPITNSTLKNCNIINGVNSSSAVIVSDGLTPASAGYFNNITIQNNNIQQAYIGIYSIAVTASGNGSGLLITGNNLNTAGASSIRLIGCYVQGVDGATVSNNNIGNIANVLDASNITGIWLASGTVNSTVSGNIISTISSTFAGSAPRGIVISPGVASANINVTANTVTGLTSSSTGTTSGISLYSATSGIQIQKNYISNIKNTEPTGWGSNGIELASALTAAAVNVNNNFVSDIASVGFIAESVFDNGYGIIITGGGGYNIDYNTVVMNTNQTADGLPAALNVGSLVTTAASVNVRNNIFVNTQTTGTDRYCFYSGAAASVYATVDYNDYYYATAPNIGRIAAANVANLAAWQVATGQEGNSLNVQPNFVSTTDFHLVASTNCRLDGYGTPIAGITTDYDNNTRDAGAPDMGADEFTTSPDPLTIATASVCDIKNVSPSGTNYLDGTCNLIARVLPSGGDPVTGQIRTCVTLDATQQIFNGEPYVQRHHDIEPTVSNQTTTSATVTLYFTDAEFALYNTTNPVWPALPTLAGGGNTDPNRANLKVTQFHGAATTNPSSPGNYPGVRVLIIPGAANVVWNGSYWAVTFNITGFSGFYVHTNNFNAPLPITVNYFTGTKQGSNHLLNWKVTCNSTPSVTMTLERSASSTGGFTGINIINATAARCNQPFNYTDAQPLKGMNYYRLKMVDVDGKISYSHIVALLNAVKGFDIVSIAPNPVVNNNFNLNVASAQAGKMEISIFDLQGRLVNRQSLNLIAGYNSLPVSVANLSSGTYTIKGGMSDDESHVIRFVKQ